MTQPSTPTLRRRKAIPALLFLACIAGSVWTMGVYWKERGITWWPPPSVTPYDRTDSIPPGIWTFLSEASRDVPPGAQYATAAADAEKAQYVYMTAMTLLPESTARPTVYFFTERPVETGLVLDYGCLSPNRGSIVKRYRDGCVRRR